MAHRHDYATSLLDASFEVCQNRRGCPEPQRKKGAAEGPDHSPPLPGARGAFVGGIAGEIMRHLRTTPSTSDEVEQALGLRHQSASAAINRLAYEGEIEPVGYRPTSSGRQAKVWAATKQ